MITMRSIRKAYRAGFTEGISGLQPTSWWYASEVMDNHDVRRLIRDAGHEDGYRRWKERHDAEHRRMMGEPPKVTLDPGYFV